MWKTWMLSLGLLLPLSTAAAPAAEEPAVAAAAAMKAAPLPDLVGKWEGSGTIRHGAGEPERFVGQETVEARLDGRVLVIEGEHWTPDRSRKVHHALALLSYDAGKKAYRFESKLANGRGGDFAAHLEGGALVWEMDGPGGHLRYVIRVEGDLWKETGSIEREGKWLPFFEMEMRRKRS
jgi:hypothetical protein